jgi:hypothetical protein
LQLTTPELKGYDTVFPGENWFFFWRTSPSLWESKLREFNGASPILVPIYWGLHSDQPEQFDFGTYRPETDLKRLFEVIKSVGKEVSFLLPLTPAPFLPNGGLPSFLARNMLIDDNGLAHAVVDNDGRINKLYSFYDPRIFQSFRKFVWNIGQYFIKTGINCEIYGVQSYYLEDGELKSFFMDQSVVFQQGYSRYLKQIETDKSQNVAGSENYPDINEENMREEYAQQIKNLYTQVAEESLGGHWAGEIKYSFLGAAPKDIFSRSSDLWDHYSHFFKPMLKMMTKGMIPNSAILSPKVKQSSLTTAMNNIVTTSFIKSHINNDLYDDDFDMSFMPLIFFNLYNIQNHDRSGLREYIKRRYTWCFREYDNFQFHVEEMDHKIHAFSLKNETIQGVTSILKLFLNGGKILVDKSGASEEILNRFNNFFIENDIKTEKVNYVTIVEKAQLGEGLFVTYEGERLAEAATIKKYNFWDTVINFLSINHLEVQADENVFYFWKIRTSNAYELNYQEIRRVYFYNTTSYKKKVSIPNHKNFAFLKSIDENHVNLKTNTLGVEVELLPGGSVNIDFGYFE